MFEDPQMLFSGIRAGDLYFTRFFAGKLISSATLKSGNALNSEQDFELGAQQLLEFKTEQTQFALSDIPQVTEKQQRKLIKMSKEGFFTPKGSAYYRNLERIALDICGLSLRAMRYGDYLWLDTLDPNTLQETIRTNESTAYENGYEITLADGLVLPQTGSSKKDLRLVTQADDRDIAWIKLATVKNNRGIPCLSAMYSSFVPVSNI